MVLINAALALRAAGGAGSPKDGVGAAAGSIDSGKALAVLESLRRFTNTKR